MLAYPTLSDSLEAARVLSPILRGVLPNPATGVKVGWVVFGYAASQVVGEPGEEVVDSGSQPQLSTTIHTEACSQELVALWLDKFCDYHEAKERGNVQALPLTIPWKEVASFLLPLLLKWLSEK